MPTTEPGRKPARKGLWDGPGIRLLAVVFAALVFAAPAAAMNDWGDGGQSGCGWWNVGRIHYLTYEWSGNLTFVRLCVQNDDGSFEDVTIDVISP